MIEVLQFVFQGLWHFVGVLILISAVGTILHAIAHEIGQGLRK